MIVQLLLVLMLLMLLVLLLLGRLVAAVCNVECGERGGRCGTTCVLASGGGQGISRSQLHACNKPHPSLTWEHLTL